MTEPIRILIVDDHPIVRDGLVAILSTQPDLQVVAEAASGAEALQLLVDFRWLQIKRKETRGRPSEEYEVNPEVMK